MTHFFSEDDLHTFEGWRSYQKFDPSTPPQAVLAMWDEVQKRIQELAVAQAVGRMSLRPPLGDGEFRYAVALEDGADLWLALWVRRSAKREVFVFYPRRDRKLAAHTSYHRDGQFHSKSYGNKFGAPQKRQPLTDDFRGVEYLGDYGGYGPKSVGAICDPADFTEILRVPSGVLGPRDGVVSVHLLEPGTEPPSEPNRRIVAQGLFRDAEPWLVIAVAATVAAPASSQTEIAI